MERGWGRGKNMKVIPAILEDNLEDIKAKLELVKPYVDLIQLDIMDGQFVPNNTYNSPEGIEDLDIKIEAHLMINHPEFHVAKWNLPNIETIIVHKEAVGNMNEVIRMVKEAGKKVGVAINPRTGTNEIEEYLDDLDMVLLMSVTPGFAGQDFNRDVVEKIKHLKKVKPDLLIEVDGGVNLYNKNMLQENGVDAIAVNSVLFNDPANIEHNIKQLSS